MADGDQLSSMGLNPETQGLAAPSVAPAGAPAPQPQQPIIPPAQPGNHAKMLTILQHGLQGLGAFATALATHGAQGGIQQIQQENLAEAANQRAENADVRQQKEMELRDKAMTAQINMQTLQASRLQQLLPYEVQQERLKTAGAMIEMIKGSGLGEADLKQILNDGSHDYTNQVYQGPMGGSLSGHIAVPAPNGQGDDKEHINLVSSDAAQQAVVKDENHLNAVKTGLQNQINAMKGTLPDAVISQAQAKIDAMKPGMSLYAALAIPSTVQGLLASSAQSQKQALDLKKQKQETDPLFKLETDPSQMSGEKSSAAAALLHTAMADPNLSDQDRARVTKLYGQANLAHSAYVADEQKKIGMQQSAELSREVALAKEMEKIKGVGQPVYAMDDKGEMTLTDKNTAETRGFTNIQKIAPGQVAKDAQVSRQLNDVQLKMNRLASSTQALDDPQTRRLISQAIGEDGMKLGLWGTEMPTDWLNRLGKSSSMNQMSEQGREFVRSYFGAREAAMGFQRVLTGSGRSSESQIKALLAQIPGPESGSADNADQQLKAFQEQMDQMRQGIPKFPGIKNVEDGVTPATQKHVHDTFKDVPNTGEGEPQWKKDLRQQMSTDN